ncbi:MAG TPA: SGNH/GDSL hydrolase family protein [Burkholderiaceae bacterium]|nr:SGNH/GDSL hydrolase family protein [Burkholderiaceae bacterium]
MNYRIFQRLSKHLSHRLFILPLLSLLLAAMAGCADSDKSSTSDYTQLIVFGASLSDNGNADNLVPGLHPGAPYYPGRASNGLLWIDEFAAQLGNSVKPFIKGGSNYAVGGARTCGITGTSVHPLDMCEQVSVYLAQVNGKADANALYVVDTTAVGNNIFGVVNNGLSHSAITDDAPADIRRLMDKLYIAGARKFLVNNLPNVGDTPKGRNSTASSTITSLSNQFGAALENELNSFRSSRIGTSIKIADFKSTVSSAVGFSNTTDACYVEGAGVCANPDSYVYWDNLHPTAAMGRSLAQAALNAL